MDDDTSDPIPEVYVCLAGSCRLAGAEAVLTEIEELANAVGRCNVKSSGCLGLCNQAPNAVVVKNDYTAEKYHTRIGSLEDSAKVVISATGKKPPLDDPGIQTKLSGVRAMRMREHSISVYRWNGALKAVSEQIKALDAADLDPSDLSIYNRKRTKLVEASQELLSKAGFSTRPLSSLEMPDSIENYSQWSLTNVTKISRHSAVFHFHSEDRKRGTPHPRGGGRSPPSPNTWHTTLLGEVGGNSEGPLPWVERDYTPISSALEWERGECDILMKIYPDGAATSWLHRVVSQSQTSAATSIRVWLSKPVKTLNIPQLMTGNSGYKESVLLLLAGTGVVALPQLLHHRDPYGKLGISTKKMFQLPVPMDLILSCRADDTLMLPEITKWCQEACDFADASIAGADIIKGVRHCTLLLTGEDQAREDNPFPDVTDSDIEREKLASLPNAQVLNTRLSYDLVSKALSRVAKPCRVVVSGPSSFNAAARGMLLNAKVHEDNITILEA